MIARGHAGILADIYKGTRLQATVESNRFLRSDVAVADVTLEARNFPFGLRKMLPLVVATWETGAWSIAVFRNMVPYERPGTGPVESELMEASVSNAQGDHVCGMVTLLLVELGGVGLGYLFLRTPARKSASTIRLSICETAVGVRYFEPAHRDPDGR
jgi:hypothetical protein